MFFLIFTEGQRSLVIANIKQLLSISIGIQILVHFQGTSFFLFFSQAILCGLLIFLLVTLIKL